jgi:uncharacterized repeat protein (TIGR02543 family)
LLFKSVFVLYFNILKKGNYFMKKSSILIVSILILGLIFAGCGDIANITTPSDVDSLEKNSSPIRWTGQGSNALKCELIGTSEERTKEGWIHWILNQAKNVTRPVLVLGGTGSGSYTPTNNTPGGVYEFFTSYFDIEGLTAVVNYQGELKNKAQFVIADYCPGDSGEEPTTYTVTFDSNGGTVVSPITDIAYNATISLPTAPTKAENTFAGWFSDDTTFLVPFTASTPVTASITVYAKWTADTYTVTFDSNGGNAVDPVTGIAYNATVTLPADPTLAENTFAGWFSDDTTFLVPFTASTPVTASITVYAKWTLNTYTLTMAVNPGGSGTATDQTDDSPYTSGTLVSILAVAEAGYEFDHWSATAGSFDDANDPTAAFTMPGANATVTANFQEIPPTTYMVTFSVYDVGETFRATAVDSISATDDGDTITSGDAVAAGSVVIFTATPSVGNQVKDWYVDGSPITSTNTTYTIDDLQAAVDVQVEFEAIPPTTYAVTFSVKAGTGTGALTAKVDDVAISSGDLVEEGKDVVFTAAPDTDCQVKDWFENDVSQTQTDTTYTVTNLQVAVDVQVEFEEIPVTIQYTLTLSAGTGGSVNSVSGDYDEGTAVGIEAIPDTGYQFVDWTIDSGTAANVADTSSASTNVTMNEDMTLTANFEELTYTPENYFSFNSDTGTIEKTHPDYDNIFITAYDTAGGLDVVIPPTLYGVTVEHIGSYAFYNIPITSVVIPYGVISIGDSAFCYDNDLESVIIPDTVTSIGEYAFQENNLSSVDIPDSVVSLGSQAFLDNNLISIDIPDYITYIGTYTFANNLLTEVTIPDQVKTIDESAFAGNTITSITIGADVTINDTSDSTMGIYSVYFMGVYDYNGDQLAGTYNYTGGTWIKE